MKIHKVLGSRGALALVGVVGGFAVALGAPRLAVAQQAPSGALRPPGSEGEAEAAPQYPPPDSAGYPQYSAPPPSGPGAAAPPPGYPNQPQQGYPQQGYPQQGYPQYPGYPQVPAPGQPGLAPPSSPSDPGANPGPPPPPASTLPPSDGKLQLSAANPEAQALLLGCLDAADNYRSDGVRSRCSEALTKDSQLALAHVLLAQAATSTGVAKRHLVDANEALNKRTGSEGERLLVEALVAQLEDRRPAARAALEALVAQLPNERRAYHYRGLLRYRQGDFEGAQADYLHAIELDPKYGPAYNALGHLQLRRDKLDDAQKSFEKYLEVAPKEANAHDSLAILLLRRDKLGPAIEAARKALELDGKFLKANARLGDALLFQGNPMMARRAYASLIASSDPAEHHDGAMRSARSRIFESPGIPTSKLLLDAEKELLGEAELSRKLDRKADELQALSELARVQLERAALPEAGHTVQLLSERLANRPPATKDSAASGEKVGDKLADKPNPDRAAPMLTDEEKARYGAELLLLRALLLSGIGERGLAEERVAELERIGRGAAIAQRARELRGDLAARAGERQAVVQLLESAQRPPAKLALAMALGGGKPGEQIDLPRARTILDELSKRNVNDLDGALTRGRARAWLKTLAADAKPADAKPADAKPNPV